LGKRGGMWSDVPARELVPDDLIRLRLGDAAIPVAMPTVPSVTMAVGARLLARKQANVSKLVAIEELAGMDVLCSDKTGTLTQNKLKLGEPFCVRGVNPDDVVLFGALASRAEAADAIDQAVLNGLKTKEPLKAYQVLHFQPFDPVGKRTEATLKTADGKQFKVTKGAPQVISKLAANIRLVQGEVEKAVNEFAARSFRSLGVARTDEQDRWQMLGVLLLSDPPREESKTTIATAKGMGVRVKMVKHQGHGGRTWRLTSGSRAPWPQVQNARCVNSVYASCNGFTSLNPRRKRLQNSLSSLE
jgi:H+-transporting ATPase